MRQKRTIAKKHEVYANWGHDGGDRRFSFERDQMGAGGVSDGGACALWERSGDQSRLAAAGCIFKGDKAYNLLLEDVTDPKCSYAVFSDERGLIRQGKSIDCAL